MLGAPLYPVTRSSFDLSCVALRTISDRSDHLPPAPNLIEVALGCPGGAMVAHTWRSRPRKRVVHRKPHPRAGRS